MRRGSSITILPSPPTPASSSRNGTSVVFPEPGGADSTADPLEVSASTRAASEASTGSSTIPEGTGTPERRLATFCGEREAWLLRSGTGTVSGVIDSFMGKLTLQDGTIVGAVLNVSADTLSVAAEGMTVGTWPLKYCRVARSNESEFVITIDGEPTTFQPVDAYRFAKAAADRFSASSLADRINVIRSMPLEPELDAAPPPSLEELVAPAPKPAPRFPFVVASLVVAAAALLTLSAINQPERDSASVTVFTPTTAAQVSVPSDGPEVFRQSIDAFVEHWNETAVRFEPELVIRDMTPATDHPLTDVVSLRAGVGGAGLLDQVKLSITVGADGVAGDLPMRAIDIAVATVDPTLKPSQRADIIRRLGFESYPTGFGLDQGPSAVVRNEIQYSLNYIAYGKLIIVSIVEDPLAD